MLPLRAPVITHDLNELKTRLDQNGNEILINRFVPTLIFYDLRFTTYVTTVLFRVWKFSSSLSICCFIIYQILIELDQHLHNSPICQKIEFSDWSWYMNLVQAGGLLTTAIALAINKFRFHTVSNSWQCAYSTTFCCVGMSVVTTMLTLTSNWGGICIDALG